MSERKEVERNTSVRTIMTIAIIVTSLAMVVTSIWFSNLLTTVFLCIIPILSFTFTVAKHNHDSNVSYTKTSIDIQTYNNKVIVSCSLKSLHPKRLFIDKAFLFIDKGIIDNGIYYFKHIICHEYGEELCVVAKKMESGGIRNYKDINPDGEGLFFEMLHLSAATILYLDINEEFSDDCVFELTEGVYRAMLVITFKNASCNCSIKSFIINSKI